MRTAALISLAGLCLPACTLLFPFESSSNGDACFSEGAEAEENDDPESAMPLCLGARIAGSFREVGEGAPVDEDWYVVTLGAADGVVLATDDPDGQACEHGNDTVVFRYPDPPAPAAVEFGEGGCSGNVCAQSLGQGDCNDNLPEGSDCARLSHQSLQGERVFFRVIEYCGRPGMYGLSVTGT